MARALVFEAYRTLFDVHSAYAARLQRAAPLALTERQEAHNDQRHKQNTTGRKTCRFRGVRSLPWLCCRSLS
jgi:FMN phosphatase YigB (HAD superfamily)